jgi:zinc/manganese transport system substrate-binding protein
VKRIAMILLMLAPLHLVHAKLRVLATTSDLAAIAAAVGGNHVEVHAIARGGQDPHFIDAKPSYILDARRADLFVRIGLELESTWEPLILEGARNSRILPGNPGHLDDSAGIERLGVPGVDVDRSMGDVHPQGNPHYWLDPWNGRQIAATLAARLQTLDPGNAEAYRINLAAFQQRVDRAMFGQTLVDQLGADLLWRHQRAGDLAGVLAQRNAVDRLAGWQGRMAPHAAQKLVTFHRSFVYFAHRFGLKIIAELEPKPGIPPSPGHLVQVIRRVQQEGVRVLLIEPFYEPKAAEAVASRTGAAVVVVANSVGGQEGVDDYVELIDNLVHRVAAALERKGAQP